MQSINDLQSSCTILIQDSSCSTCLGYLGLSTRCKLIHQCFFFNKSSYFDTKLGTFVNFFFWFRFYYLFYFWGKRITKFFISQNWGKNNPTLLRAFSSSNCGFLILCQCTLELGYKGLMQIGSGFDFRKEGQRSRMSPRSQGHSSLSRRFVACQALVRFFPTPSD